MLAPRSPRRPVSPIRSAACVALALAGQALAVDAPLVIPADSAGWPGYKTDHIYVPDSVPQFRFVLVHAEAGMAAHDEQCYALATRCVILNGLGNGAGPSDLADAAQKTGHKEIPNLPIMADGYSNFIPYATLRSNFPNQVVGFYDNFGIDQSIYPDWCGLFQNQDDGATIAQNYGGSGDNPEIYVPDWGWPHGYYSASTKTWPLFDILATGCAPKGWDPKSGKTAFLKPYDAFASTQWRGDPGSWGDGKNGLGEWPKIYAKADYPGDYRKGVWLPNEEFAWLWRAAVSRSPTQTQNDQGEANFGQVMSNTNQAGQPNIMITSPSRPYQPHRAGGVSFPLYAQNSSIDVIVKNGFATNVKPYDLAKLEIYDGMRKMGELAPNVLNIYQFHNCQLTTPGMRPFIAIATLKDGKQVTSRPAFVYVTDLFQARPTGVKYVGHGSKASRRDLRSGRGARPAGAYDLKGALQRSGQAAAGVYVAPSQP